MPKVDVYNMQGKKVSDVELSEAVFGIEPNENIVHSALVNYLANQRQGTQSTKTRAEVSGGGRKPWRQKGTGRARQGSIRAPQWIKGGIALGPKPRSYSYRINKKEKQLAIRSLLLTKLPFATVGEAKVETAADVVQVKSNFWIEGVALIIMGYTATATFQVFLNINKDYGMTFLNMTEAAAGKIGSNYALGSIFAVLLNVVLVKWIKPVRMIVVYPALSLATLLWMYCVPSPIVAQIGGFLIGATCAGGVLQFLVSVMSDLFPASKAKAVSMIMIAGALCAFSITAIAGTVTSKFGVQYTLLVSAVLAVVSIIASIVVNIRYNMLMNK